MAQSDDEASIGNRGSARKALAEADHRRQSASDEEVQQALNEMTRRVG